MSYSFNINAASKAAAKSSVAAELEKVVQSQPVHAADRAAAQAAADAFIDLLDDGDERPIAVSVSGSVSYAHDGSPDKLTTTSVSVYARFA